MTCADSVPLNDDKENVTVVNTADNHPNHEHNQGGDGCSPLCVCHCCHLHFFPVAEVVFSHPVKLPVTFFSHYQGLESIEISEFLKPPIS